MKRFAFPLLAACLLVSGAALAGDTGTYRIESYRVDLTPHSDGTVALSYYQRWLVTGGHIPWITVGAANGDFETAGYGGAVAALSPVNQGGWTGVRLDLDRDYRPGETFEASFSIVQRRLFHAEEGTYRLDFTPGWYEAAGIDTMRVAVKFFADLSTVTAEPPASAVSGNEMIWLATGLGRGERFRVRVSFPAGLFPAGIEKGHLARGASGGVPFVVAIAIVVLFIVVLLSIRAAVRSAGGRYTGGRIFYGGFPGAGSRGGSSRGGRSTGGGGGFGGSSYSCACACVSCACACACAGGGGAGCSRKLEHACPVCEKRSDA